ncbi:GRB10-interacting GYF protein 2-like isoform X2 [Cimex lectularius]|uniref:GYF domain-containing protein n=1 Tax=Cimex lectularius TaxID=79782 RepID=A0A8I6SLR3_CIMLE|nr:GRB10-interacting GYF protein 2-like isoform X2 [Cimex lectularius]XP_024083431.1 GRB10-interacting GYF protein 2-like isoform X2 [Cimex lectularius]
MTESMKFGPEWFFSSRLRNLSETPVQPQVRYQLADFRYGKEEMLALFSPNLQPPDSLKVLVPKGVYIEKAQPPLTLTTMTDEETRMWNRGINPDMLPRTPGKGEGRGGLRGAGGRGRGRGGSTYYSSGRGGGGAGAGGNPVGGYGDDIEPVPGNVGAVRYGERPTRPFERSQSERERGRDSWSDRNGGEGRGGGGNRNSDGNWRRTRGGGGDEEDWRPPKWSGSANSYGRNTSWREEDNWDMGNSHAKGNTHLPEWATEKNSEGGGTFDSSGAFRSTEMPLEDEDDRLKERHVFKKAEPIQPKQPDKEEAAAAEEEPPGDQQPDESSTTDPGGSAMQAQHHQPQAQMLPQPPQVQHMPPMQQQPPSPIHQAKQNSPCQKKEAQPDLHLDDSIGHITDDLAADLAKLMEDEEDEKKGKQWFYRDPQGEIQGPFSCAEMAEWFQTGYFSLNLLVRRACDTHYAPLGDLIANWGYIPFLPENHPLNKEGLNQPNHQAKEHYLLNQYQQQYRLMMMRQQAARMSTKPPHEWIESQQHQMMDQVIHPPFQQQMTPHHVNNNNLRALLAQMQQQQTLNAQQQTQSSGGGGTQPFQQPHQPPMGKPPPPPRTTEEISRTVCDFLRGLQAKSEQQQAAAAAAQQGAPIESILGGANFHQPPPPPPQSLQNNSTAIQNLLRKMQATHQNKMQVNSNSESIWNGINWNQWNHLNPKGIKTEQQVLEEQLRAEEERMREELRKHEEAKRQQEAAEEEKKHINTLAMREAEELSRRQQQEEEDIRRKQEASRRAEVERQRKGEEKRKKDEEKRKQEEEKKERDRLREEERKKKEAEEAKKKAAADVMAKVQRSQWCPPAASNTSLLEIQRSEREQQQMLRGLQQQQQQQQQMESQKNSFMHLKWTEVQRHLTVESLADIQAEQLEQLMKIEKEKQEREKEKASSVPQTLGSWSQGLTWGSGLMAPGSVWQNTGGGSSAGNLGGSGFWEQIGNPAKLPSPSIAPPSQAQRNVSSPSQPIGTVPQGKETKSKAKREEVGVLKLFNNCHYDEFTQWCTSALANIQSTVDIPTFVSFLRDVESASEVQEYVQEYLDDEKEAKEFARQFVERRNRLAGGQQTAKSSVQSSSSSKEDFQQVKSKNKKAKKNKMQKVDTRILGFSTTSAPDRINVGDREYPNDV